MLHAIIESCTIDVAAFDDAANRSWQGGFASLHGVFTSLRKYSESHLFIFIYRVYVIYIVFFFENY